MIPLLAKTRFLPLLLLALLAPLRGAEPIRALAQEHVVVAESPDPEKIALYNPAIARLDSGRLVASFQSAEISGPSLDKIVEAFFGITLPNALKSPPRPAPETRFLTSDDAGKTWQSRGSAPLGQGRFIVSKSGLYFLGQRGDLLIVKSTDGGTTWGKSSPLTQGEMWHGTAANVWYAKGNIYLAMERRIGRAVKGWPPGELAPVLLRARDGADLTRRESWTFASPLPFCDIIPGYKENIPAVEFVGIPFFPPMYPATRLLGGWRTMPPMGWLEANVAQITDPNHLWFDPSGRTFHLLMRAHTGGPGYAALAKAVENPDGTITTSLVRAPSGKTLLFLPFPGGQMRFHILYDEKTRLFWMVGTQVTDSMTRPEALPQERYGLACEERQRLVLHFSKNLVDWCFAGLVASGNTAKEARHYASMLIDGDDLLILSRSGDARAKSTHDGNLITLHRVKDFRFLVY